MFSTFSETPNDRGRERGKSQEVSSGSFDALKSDAGKSCSTQMTPGDTADEFLRPARVAAIPWLLFTRRAASAILSFRKYVRRTFARHSCVATRVVSAVCRRDNGAVTPR